MQRQPVSRSRPITQSKSFHISQSPQHQSYRAAPIQSISRFISSKPLSSGIHGSHSNTSSLRTRLPSSQHTTMKQLPMKRLNASHMHIPRRSFSIIKKTINDGDLYTRESTKVLNTICERIEQPDIDLKYDVDIDYSGDVLNLETSKGTWVLNKHNVTKQIWLSSPMSGPSKYNYFPPNFNPDTDTSRIYNPDEGQHGEWKSERDGVTKLSTLLEKELSQVFDIPIQFDHKF